MARSFGRTSDRQDTREHGDALNSIASRLNGDLPADISVTGDVSAGGNVSAGGTVHAAGDIDTDSNLKWKSGTANLVTLDHAATAARTVVVQDASDTLVGRATTDTLTNKTLTSPTINAGALSGTFSGTPTFSGNVTLSAALLGLPWTDFSASVTLTQSTARSKSSVTARSVTLGKLVAVQVQMTCTDAGVANNAVLIGGLPTARASGLMLGMMSVFDLSAATYYVGIANGLTQTVIQGIAHGATAALGATGGSFTAALANGDVISAFLLYEAS